MSKEITAEQVRVALERFVAKVAGSVKTFYGTIESVDETNYTCVVIPSDGGAVYHGVRLKPTVNDIIEGVIPIPTVGSSVVVGRATSANDCFIMICGEVSKYIIKAKETIILNEDKYTSVKGKELQDELNKLKAAVKQIKSAIQGAAVAVGDGGTAFKANIIAALAVFDTGDFSNITNDKVKHG